MIFITGTPENKGRVASHPRKRHSSSKSAASRRPSTPSSSRSSPRRRNSTAEDKTELALQSPLTSAWDDYIEVSSHGNACSVLNSALHTDLRLISHQDTTGGESACFGISLPPYTPSDVPSRDRIPGIQQYQTPVDYASHPEAGLPLPNGEFNVSAHCLAQLPGVMKGVDSRESHCVFLYEVCQRSSSTHCTNANRSQE